MNLFLRDLFGTIAGGSSIDRVPADIDFIPVDGSGKTLQIKGGKVAWLGLKNPLTQKYAYDFCYPVASVVDKLAEFDITGCIEINRLTGKGKENTATNEWANRMRALLAQPNPLQSWEQFRGQQVIYKRTFGFCPVLPVIPAGFEDQPEYATSMINLPPWLFKAIGTQKFLYESRIEDIVKTYTISLLGKTTPIDPKNIFILEDSYMTDHTNNNYILPQSRLVGLDMAVSNICAAMEADNVLLKKRGPLGFISSDPGKDVVGTIPMNDEEREELQRDLQQYGLSLQQYQYVITKSAAKWNPTSFDVNQLGTKATIQACEKAICIRYNFPYVLYQETDATYANGGEAKKGVYQDNVIPNNKKDLEKYNKFFKAAENNCKIEADFSHVAAMQEDEKYKGQAALLTDQALQLEYTNNLITLNQWRTARGYDTTADGDVYYKDVVTQNQNTNGNQENSNQNGQAQSSN